jgi:membrane-associated phospholipid phosphatase
VNEQREEVTEKNEDAEARRKNNAAGVNDETMVSRSQAWLYPADKVVIVYLTIIAALIIAFSFRIPVWPPLIAAHLLVIALIFGLAKWSQSISRRASALPHSGSKPSRFSVISISQFIHDWYPVALIPTTYKELSYLIPLIHPHDFDIELAAIDHRLFGIPPTVWMERFTWPPITEVLQIVYATYYFLPVILGAVLWRKGWFEQFKFWVFIVALGFYVSYLGYITIPATGPRFLPSIQAAQSFPLTGVWLFQSLRESLDRAEGVTRDCFPSGHTELTLLVLYYARRFHRPTFWWMLPIGTALILSTVYLRYHYVVDVIAGAAAAIFVILIAKPLYRLLSREPGAGGREPVSVSLPPGP